MTLGTITTQVSLKGNATPTAVGASTQARTLGMEFSTTFTDADILYSLTVTRTGATDVVTITLASGVAVKTTGTPDVKRRGTGTSDLAAEDFEGVTLPAMATLYAIGCENHDTTQSNAISFDFQDASTSIYYARLGGGSGSVWTPGSYAIAGANDDLIITMGATVTSGTVTVCGKTT